MNRCFWPVAIWGPQTQISLRPDYVIDPTFAEYTAGRDPVLERALELVKQHP